MLRKVVSCMMLVVGLLLVAAPTNAIPQEPRPACAQVTDQEEFLPFYVYLQDGARQIWREDNGYPGLQRMSCLDNGGQRIDGDVRVHNAFDAIP